MIQEFLESSTRLLNNLKSYVNQVFIFSSKKSLTVDLIFNNQNSRVLSLEKDVSDVRKVLKNNHPGFVIIPGVIALNGENMFLMWFESVYR